MEQQRNPGVWAGEVGVRDAYFDIHQNIVGEAGGSRRSLTPRPVPDNIRAADGVWRVPLTTHRAKDSSSWTGLSSSHWKALRFSSETLEFRCSFHVEIPGQ